jgi:hypothetical protein
LCGEPSGLVLAIEQLDVHDEVGRSFGQVVEAVDEVAAQ